MKTMNEVKNAESTRALDPDKLNAITGGIAQVNYDTGKYIYYTVARGDCLSVIANRYGATTDIVYILNKAAIGPNRNLIQPGMVLRIPIL